MSAKAFRRVKVVVVLVAGGVLLGSGSCAVGNFWADLWVQIWSTAVTTAVAEIVTTALSG